MELLKYKIKKKTSAGFSMPELVVSIAIITILTGVIMFRYGDFNGTILLTSQAYEVALDVREAQVFSLSVRGTQSGNYRDPYGLYFDLNNPNEYVLFLDANGNGAYSASEKVNTIRLDPRFEISGLCVDDHPGCTHPATTAAVTFKRPNFDANFVVTGPASSPNSFAVQISPINGSAVREVLVANTGLISVGN